MVACVCSFCAYVPVHFLGVFFQSWITPGLPVRMQQLSCSTISFVEVFSLVLLFYCFFFTIFWKVRQKQFQVLCPGRILRKVPLVLGSVLCAQISQKWPEIPSLFSPWEALSLQTPWEGWGCKLGRNIQRNQNYFHKIFFLSDNAHTHLFVLRHCALSITLPAKKSPALAEVLSGCLQGGITPEEGIFPTSSRLRRAEQWYWGS